jgi:hypothetical protein
MLHLMTTVAVILAAVVGALAAWTVDRYLPAERRCDNNEVAGMLFSIIGVVYAILLTFVTITVWEASSEAEESSLAEARSVVEINRYANTLAAPDQQTLHDLVRRYVDVVANQEWPRMARGEPVTGAGADVLDAMWTAIDAKPAADGYALARQTEVHTDLRALAEARQTRIAAADATIPMVIWYSLIFSAFLVVINALMFGVHGRTFYIGMVAILAAVSALLLFSVYELESPYQRGERVTVDSFVSVVRDLAV